MPITLTSLTILVAIIAISVFGRSYQAAMPNRTFTQSATAVITSTSNGYNVSNITVLSPFTLVFNGSTLNIHINYMTPNSTALSINNSAYGLFLNIPQLVHQSATTNIYADLVRANYYTKPQSVTVLFYASPRPKQATLNSTYQIPGGTPLDVKVDKINTTVILKSVTAISVRLVIWNITNSTAPPTNYTSLLALNTTVTAYQKMNVSLSVAYACSILPGAATPFEQASDGTWVAINQYAINSSACTITFPIPEKSIVGLFENNRYVVQSTSATTSAPTSATTSVAQTTTIPQAASKNVSPGTEVAIGAIAIIVAIGAILYLMKGRRPPKAHHRQKKHHEASDMQQQL